jgi:hypothetical protein
MQMEKNLQLSQLLDAHAPEEVLRETVELGTLIGKEFKEDYYILAFRDVQRLFRGDYPGYQACNTEYHDFTHTSDVTLAMARLMHGAFVSGVEFSGREVQMGLAAALMHDTGYIQANTDLDGTGAKYTATHIGRSVDFLHDYSRCNIICEGFTMKDISDILYCTGLSVNIGEIDFSSPATALLGKMLGTADLLGQMADRLYLEKLPFLYREFVEGGIPQFANEFDLLKKTIDFYGLTQKRFAGEFNGVNGYMRHHFRARWGIDRDLYQENIQRHMNYLQNILDAYREDFVKGLRRRRESGFLVPAVSGTANGA